ncbi:MAG: hypothetical protein R3B96_10675 [Pirellulaceae bacterium]
MKSRELPICDVEIGHRTATACHLGNIAIRLGRAIRWNAADEKIEGDDEARRCARDRCELLGRSKVSGQLEKDSLHGSAPFLYRDGPAGGLLGLDGPDQHLGRPFVTSGARDAAALGVALTGGAASGTVGAVSPGVGQSLVPSGHLDPAPAALLAFAEPRRVAAPATSRRLQRRLGGLSPAIGLRREAARQRLAAGLEIASRCRACTCSSPSNTNLGPARYNWCRREAGKIRWAGSKSNALAKELREVKSLPYRSDTDYSLSGLLLACGSAIWVTLARQSVADSLAEMLRL